MVTLIYISFAALLISVLAVLKSFLFPSEKTILLRIAESRSLDQLKKVQNQIFKYLRVKGNLYMYQKMLEAFDVKYKELC
jgi:hypothetical protein